ncbi:MAG: sensor histidine kinase [Candidatus Hodarchaeales archaeon]
MSDSKKKNRIFALFNSREEVISFLKSAMSKSGITLNLIVFSPTNEIDDLTQDIHENFRPVTFEFPKVFSSKWSTSFKRRLEKHFDEVGDFKGAQSFFIDYSLVKPVKRVVKFIERELTAKIDNKKVKYRIFSVFTEKSMNYKLTLQLAITYPMLCLTDTSILPNFFYDLSESGTPPTTLKEFYEPIQMLLEELKKCSMECERLNKELFLSETQKNVLESTVGTYLAQERDAGFITHTPADIVSLLEFNDLKRKFNQKTQILYTVTHDLKSPLAAIQGFAEILKKGMAGPINPEMEKHLGVIISNAKRLARMIESILEYERYDSSDYVVGKEQLDLVEILQEAKMSVLPQMINRGQRIEFFTPDHLEFFANRGLIIRAIQNLLDNAIKYSPPEKGIIKVYAEEIDHKNEKMIKIIVKDNGFGFRKKDLSHVFEPFTKFEPGSRSTGLGLSITKKIIEDIHEGTIEITSPGRNKGTKVKILLPKF